MIDYKILFSAFKYSPDFSTLRDFLCDSVRDLNSYVPPYETPYKNSYSNSYSNPNKCNHKRKDFYGLQGIYVILSKDYEILYIGKGNCVYRALYRHFAEWCSKSRKDGNGNIFRDTYYERDSVLTKIIILPTNIFPDISTDSSTDISIYTIERYLIDTFTPRDNIYHNPKVNREIGRENSLINSNDSYIPRFDSYGNLIIRNPPLHYQPDFQVLVELGNVLFEKYYFEHGYYPF